jgi:hypothetical protein
LKTKYLAGIGHHDDDPQTPDFWASAIGLTQAAMAVKTGAFIGVGTVRSSECCIVETMQGRIALVDAPISATERIVMLWQPRCRSNSRDARYGKPVSHGKRFEPVQS